MYPFQRGLSRYIFALRIFKFKLQLLCRFVFCFLFFSFLSQSYLVTFYWLSSLLFYKLTQIANNCEVVLGSDCTNCLKCLPGNFFVSDRSCQPPPVISGQVNFTNALHARLCSTVSTTISTNASRGNLLVTVNALFCFSFSKTASLCLCVLNLYQFPWCYRPFAILF